MPNWPDPPQTKFDYEKTVAPVTATHGEGEVGEHVPAGPSGLDAGHHHADAGHHQPPAGKFGGATALRGGTFDEHHLDESKGESVDLLSGRTISHDLSQLEHGKKFDPQSHLHGLPLKAIYINK